MARIYPTGWNSPVLTGAAAREVATLEVLQAGLPDTYAVYHGVHWTRVSHGFAAFGEADFIVVSPAGRVLVIEQKSGSLEETADGLVKVYVSGRKSVASQIARTMHGLHGRFTQAFGGGNYRIEPLLYCPDHRVQRPAIAGMDPARIVDATRAAELCTIIASILPPGDAALPCAPGLHAFLSDELSLTPDAGATIGEVTRRVTRVSGGLAAWARTLDFAPFRLRVIGTAGSGKTQLAIRVLEDAAHAKQRALYLCFNRPLADHVKRIVPSSVDVMTYHQLCQLAASAQGETVTFGTRDTFAALERALEAWQPDAARRYDTVIVDEGQDFREAWVEPIGRLLAPQGRWWWLEDPMQNLYLRPGVALPGWVEMRAMTNYRTPRDLVSFISQLGNAPLQIEAASPFDQSDVGLLSYAGTSALATTKEALGMAFAAGYRAQDIAVLSFQGRERSALAQLDQLGSYRLRSFTGDYDAHGDPVWREGNVLFESVYRFKGQCAPCVILTEVDFEAFDELVARRLFVGATRATLKLILVMSDRAAQQLIERVGAI